MDDLARLMLDTEGIGRAERAERARRALIAYWPYRDATAEIVGDLIADLLHFLEAEGCNVEEAQSALDAAAYTYFAEREDDF